MYTLILAFITAFTLTYNVIPSIIRISEKKRLFDEPGERRSHTVQTPSLGGIGIFAGVLFSIVLWTPFTVFGDLQYILCAFIIIFLIGVSDDLDPLTPTNKLIGQLLAAVILVFRVVEHADNGIAAMNIDPARNFRRVIIIKYFF